MIEFSLQQQRERDARRLSRIFNSLPDEVQKECLDEGLWRGGKIVAQHAKRPGYAFQDRTGGLRRTIRRQSRRKKGRRFTNVIAGDTAKRAENGVFYAHIVEFGAPNRGTRARPFLARAAEETKDQVLREVANFTENTGLQRAADKAKSGA